MIYYKKSRLKKFLAKLSKLKDIKLTNISFSIVKVAISSVFVLILSVYALYLFFIPKFVTTEKVEDLIKKNFKIDIDIDNLQVKPDYKFDIEILADRINISKNLVIIEKPYIEFSLLTSFCTIKTKKITLNTKFLKTKKYEYPDFFNMASSDLKIKNVKILCDEFIFNLFDENTKINYMVKSLDNTISFSDVDKPFLIKSRGYIEGNKRKINDFNLKGEFRLSEEVLEQVKKTIENLDYNPFIEADKYKFYAKTDIDLKQIKSGFKGSVSLSDISFVFNGIQIPKNSLTLLFEGDKIKADCDFKILKDQFVNLKLYACHSKNRFIELKLKSSTINLADLKNVLGAFSEILNLDFNLNNIILTGSANADVYLKSNFKTLTSSGSARITNAKLTDKSTNLTLDNINSNIDFQNNKINISKASADVGKSKFYLYGNVDEKTNLDLKIYSDTINIAQIINLLQTFKIPVIDDYDFKSGMLNVKADVKGNLKKPLIVTNSRLSNFKMYIKSAKTLFSTSDVLISTNAENKIKVIAKNNTADVQNYKIKVNEAILDILNDEITLNKTKGTIDKINFDIDANIKNYLKKPVALVNISAIIPSQNNILIIKNKNPLLKLNIVADENKLQLKDLKLIENSTVLACASGNILNYIKNPQFDNLKLTIENKISLILPNFDNLGFDIKGIANVKGTAKTPDISAQLNLYNLICKKYALNIKDVILNIKNSNCTVSITNGKIFDLTFDLMSEAELEPNKITARYASISSPYVNLDSVGKYINNIPDFDFEVQDLKGHIDSLNAMDFSLSNFEFEGSMKNNILNLKKFSAFLCDGQVEGSITTNIKTLNSKTEFNLKDANVRKLSRSLKEFSIAASGHLSSFAQVEFKGIDYESILKTIKGNVRFNINNGELAQFAKLERYLQAGNILSQSILKLNINSIVSSVSKQNTGEFKTIEGEVKLNSPNADIEYINTIGTNMSTHTEGKCDIVKQTVNVKVLGQIPLSTVKVMGDIGGFSPKKLVDKIKNKDAKGIIETVTISPVEKMMSTYITKEEDAKIPPLTYECETRKFIVFINGLISNASSVQLFKWIIEE